MKRPSFLAASVLILAGCAGAGGPIYEFRPADALRYQVSEHGVLTVDTPVGQQRATDSTRVTLAIEIAGKTDEELLPADVAERFRISDQEVLQECELIRLEERAMTRSGEAITFDTIKVPLPDPEGEPIGLLGVSRDITERKRAEEEIQRRTSQMESLRELALEIMAQLDLDALLRSIVSRAMSSMLSPPMRVVVWEK